MSTANRMAFPPHACPAGSARTFRPGAWTESLKWPLTVASINTEMAEQEDGEIPGLTLLRAGKGTRQLPP